MTTLVIADLHNKVNWVTPFITALEQKIKIDEIVFLGDYFDEFHDTPYEAEGTARWLQESLRDKRRHHCIGNHDMPYLLPKVPKSQQCPGWSAMKDSAVNKVLRREEWDQLLTAYYSQGWLFSHAGFTAELFANPIGVTDPAALIKKTEHALGLMKGGIHRDEFGPGSRMGDLEPGGVTWCDWGDFNPIVGIQQVVGHTPDGYIRNKESVKGEKNYCIDCNSRVALLIVDGVPQVVNTMTR